MERMGHMIRYEWKKIFGRRLNIIAMISGYVLLAGCVFSFINGAAFYDKETDSYVEGIEGIRLEQERAEEKEDEISEEYITRVVKEIQDYGMDLESDEAYRKVIRPMGDLFYFIAGNYTDMREQYADRNALMEIDLTDGARFYRQRMNKITDYLNMDFSYGNFSQAEKEYWIQKAENTIIPFAWGDKCIMDMVWNIIVIGFYLWFVIVICVSPVFASEHESGAASLLLTAKYGKDRLIRCKIAASVLFAAGYLFVGIASGVCAIGLLFGFPGIDLPVQVWNSVIPYNLAAGQACFYNLLILLLIGIVITLFVLFCSARFKSSLATMAAGIIILIGPVFFPMSKNSGLWNHMNYLFPVRAVFLKEALGAYVSYTLGKWVVPYAVMVVLVYLVIGIVLLIFTRKGFIKVK